MAKTESTRSSAPCRWTSRSTTTWSERADGDHGRPRAAAAALDWLGLDLVADDREAATAAGRAYRAYRRAGGTRRRMLPDFLIGAHALVHADRLLTRDRGFYRSHFAKLTILEP